MYPQWLLSYWLCQLSPAVIKYCHFLGSLNYKDWWPCNHLTRELFFFVVKSIKQSLYIIEMFHLNSCVHIIYTMHYPPKLNIYNYFGECVTNRFVHCPIGKKGSKWVKFIIRCCNISQQPFTCSLHDCGQAIEQPCWHIICTITILLYQCLYNIVP